MQDQLLPQSRAERLIALGRAVLAAASIGAVYLDPIEPERNPLLTYTLLIAYALYAVAFVLWAIFGPAGTSPRLRIGSHVLDLVFFGTINYLTAGASSPFFVFFVFSIVCSILRFGRRGTALTAEGRALPSIPPIRNEPPGYVKLSIPYPYPLPIFA